MISNLLPHLHYFWLVAQELSFTKAAAKARVSQSAVSHQIKLLEEKLDTQLFLRKARGPMTLTNEGNALFQRCEEIFHNIESSLEEIKGETIAGRLAISAPIQFGSNILVPFLPRLLKKYPELKPRIDITDQLADFREGKIDIALRWRPPADPNLNMEVLIGEQYVVVASPKYIKSHPPIRSKSDFKNHRIVTYNEKDWFGLTDLANSGKELLVKEQLVISSVPGILQGVIHGLGVAILPTHVVCEAIRNKKLIIVLPSLKAKCEPVYAVWPKRRHPSPKIEAFLSLFRKYLDQTFHGVGFCQV